MSPMTESTSRWKDCAVLETHRQALEIVQAPWCDDASLVPVLGVDQDLVERLVQIDLAKDDTARDVIGEVFEVGEGVEIQLSLLVELAVVPDWTKFSIGLWSKMKG